MQVWRTKGILGRVGWSDRISTPTRIASCLLCACLCCVSKDTHRLTFAAFHLSQAHCSNGNQNLSSQRLVQLLILVRTKTRGLDL